MRIHTRDWQRSDMAVIVMAQICAMKSHVPDQHSSLTPLVEEASGEAAARAGELVGVGRTRPLRNGLVEVTLTIGDGSARIRKATQRAPRSATAAISDRPTPRVGTIATPWASYCVNGDILWKQRSCPSVLGAFKRSRGIILAAPAPSEPKQGVASFHRHVNESQLAIIATKMMPQLEAEAAKRRNQAQGSPQGQKSVPPLVEEQTGEAAAQAGQLVGVGKTTIQNAKTVADQTGIGGMLDMAIVARGTP